MKKITFLFIVLLFFSCKNSSENNYKNTLGILETKTDVVELTANNGKARLLISPELQGKIITSTYGGLQGNINGWIEEGFFSNNNFNLNNIGGEDRIWIGPLGSQFSFYYQQIEPLEETNWKVPEPLHKGSFQMISKNKKTIQLQKEISLENFTGTKFDLKIDRTLSIFELLKVEKNLNILIPKNLKYVGFESKNTITNIGKNPHTKETGLISVWSAGMYEGTDETVVIIPLQKKTSLEDIYTYMGALDSSRLQIVNNTVLYKTDGKFRSKIGIPPKLAPKIYGCYTKDKNQLTIVQYQKTNDSLYFNSNVTVQENPYKGEVIPIYNNGTMDYSPTEKTSFYELESTSAMQELLVNESVSHYHRIYHFQGKNSDLELISKQLLGISLKDCTLKK